MKAVAVLVGLFAIGVLAVPANARPLSDHDMKRLKRFARRLCRDLWHNEGHGSHSACPSCGGRWGRKEQIRGERQRLAYLASEAARWAKQHGWQEPR